MRSRFGVSTAAARRAAFRGAAACTAASASRAIITSVDLTIASASSPRLQLQLLDRVAGDHRGQRLVADAQAHLREQPFDAHLVDVAAQLVAAADRRR